MNETSILSLDDIVEMGAVAKKNSSVKAFVDVFIQWAKAMQRRLANAEAVTETNAYRAFILLRDLRGKGLRLINHRDTHDDRGMKKVEFIMEDPKGNIYCGRGDNDYLAVQSVAVQWDIRTNSKQ